MLEEVEQAVISMYAANESKKVKSIRFKGKIGQTPVCALLDSGSTHSFVNPEVLKGLTLPITQATLMVANGEKMVTDTKVSMLALKWTIQGHEFEKEKRLLAVQGYDMILGLDWLERLGPMQIDWGKGRLEFSKDGKWIKLQVKEEVAEVKLVKGELNLHKEEKMGSEVIIAHLVAMTFELGFDKSLTPQPNTLESSLDWKMCLLAKAEKECEGFLDGVWGW